MMKLVFLFAIVVASLAAPQYYNGLGRQIAILRLNNDIYPDGSYNYAYQTENGISAQEQGQQKAVGNSVGTVAQGSYQYTSPEGLPVQVQYIADENGFQPVGNVVPQAIQRGVEYNVRNAALNPYNPNVPFRNYY